VKSLIWGNDISRGICREHPKCVICGLHSVVDEHYKFDENDPVLIGNYVSEGLAAFIFRIIQES
jgi:hypothetical protein